MLDQQDIQTISSMMDKRFEDFEKRNDARFEDFEKRNDARFEDFEKRMDKRFEDFEARMDEKMDKRFEAFEARMDEKMDKRFEDFETRMDEKMDKRFEGFEERIMKNVATLMDAKFQQQFNLLAEQLHLMSERMIPESRIVALEDNDEILFPAIRRLSRDVEALKKDVQELKTAT